MPLSKEHSADVPPYIASQLSTMREAVLQVFPADHQPSAGGGGGVRAILAARIAPTSIPLLERLRDPQARRAATARLRDALPSLPSCTKEDRVALVMGVGKRKDGVFDWNEVDQSGTSRELRGSEASRILHSDPRALAALNSVDPAGVETSSLYRLALSAMYALLLESSPEEESTTSASHEVLLEYGGDIASQDWLEELADVRAIDERFNGPRRKEFVVNSLRTLVRDMAAVGCASSRAAEFGMVAFHPDDEDDDPQQHAETSQQRRDWYRDDVVRTLLVVACMWQVVTGRIRRVLFMMANRSPLLSPVSRSHRAVAESMRRAASPEERLEGGTIVLRSSYTVGGSPTRRGVAIPDMLPDDIKKSGLCRGRKMVSEVMTAKQSAEGASEAEARRDVARAKRETTAAMVDAVRRSGGSVFKYMNQRTGLYLPNARSTPTTMKGPPEDSSDILPAFPAKMPSVDDIIRARSSLALASEEVTAHHQSNTRSRRKAPEPLYVSHQRHRDRRSSPRREAFALHTSSVLKGVEGHPELTPTTADEVFKCRSATMAAFNRYQFQRDRCEYALQPERQRVESIARRHYKTKQRRFREQIKNYELLSDF
jgi:hypothetical protein